VPTLTVETTRTDGVTFVELSLEAECPHRVRVESRLDGPVWPPRENGRPAAGWDAGGVTARVSAGRTPFGFATPARPEGTVAEIAAAEPIRTNLPSGVAAWLERVEARVEAAESLAAADGLPAATRAVASVGGLAAVESLAATLARDRRALSRLSVAPEDLTERAAAAEIPTGTFARLAQSQSRRS